MDKVVLTEYADMKQEINDLRKRIENNTKQLEQMKADGYVIDSVACGRKGKKPVRTVKIKGFPYPKYNERKRLLSRRIMKLEMLEGELLGLTTRVEDYIQDIPKSELRTMFRLYYVDDLTWEMVSMKMNYMFPKRSIAYTKDNCRIKHDRYLEKNL